MKRCMAVLLAVMLLFSPGRIYGVLGSEFYDMIEQETGLDMSEVEYQNRRAMEEMKKGFKMLGKELWQLIKQGYRELDIAFGAQYEDMLEAEPEIKTEKYVIELESDDFETYMQELKRADREVLPTVSSPIILNANGKEEYRGYMIVDKQVIATKTIMVEVPTGEMAALGKPSPTTMKEYEVPWKIEYTLHKHEMENKGTAAAIGRVLAGFVGLQWVYTQTCACGYESVITWDMPVDDDLLNLPSASVKDAPSQNNHPAYK